MMSMNFVSYQSFETNTIQVVIRYAIQKFLREIQLSRPTLYIPSNMKQNI